MSRMKSQALAKQPSQAHDEGRLASARLTHYTVAPLRLTPFSAPSL